jgi:hypothetical protein
LFAEDKIRGDHLLGPLLQTQVGFYAFVHIFSNFLLSETYFNEETYTKIGMDRIKNVNLPSLINRITENNEYGKYYKIFTDTSVDVFTPMNLNINEQQHIEEQKKQWPISEAFQNCGPIYLDEKHISKLINKPGKIFNLI